MADTAIPLAIPLVSAYYDFIMSELPLSSGDEMYAKLQAFVFERDRDFRNRDSDISLISHPPYKRRVATLYDDYDETIHVDVYDTRTLTLEARYNTIDRMRAMKETEILFKLGLTATTQLVEVPAHLRQYLSDDQPPRHPSLVIGDFSQTQSHEYTVAHNRFDGNKKQISYQGDYVLYDGDVPIHNITFPIDKRDREQVSVASPRQAVTATYPIAEVATQITFDSNFATMTSQLKVNNGTPEEPQLLTSHESSQRNDARTMQALLKILGSSASIPTPDNLYDTIETIHGKKA